MVILRPLSLLLRDPSHETPLEPADRLAFERQRLAVRLALLFAPVMIFMDHGLGAIGAILLTTLGPIGSAAIIAVLLKRRPTAVLRFQLVMRLIDVVLVGVSVTAVHQLLARTQYDSLYLVPIISATTSHGRRGAYVVSLGSALAMIASRAYLIQTGAIEHNSFLFADALIHVVLFVITGVSVNMLMRNTANVVQRREGERYRLVSELTSDFAFAFRVGDDRRLTCEWVTEAMARMTGYTLPELLERGGFAVLVHPEDLTLVQQWWNAMIGGEARSAEFRIVTRSGELRLWRGQARPVFEPETGRVVHIVGAAEDITERKRWETALEHQALHDALTDLPNRALLQDRLAAAIASAQRERSHLALLMMDLNRFKDVNDTFGHHHGDLLLQQVAQRLRGSVRAGDTVARLGGDEFAVLLPHTNAAEDAEHVAFNLLRVLEAPFEVEGRRLEIGASIGLALFPEHAADADALLKRADTAMYAAKRGGDGCVIYADELDRHSVNRPELTGELRHAIDAGELVLHYQPKVRVATGEVVGVEALVRWQHPRLGLLGPDRFIPLAEETGLIKSLTDWVLRTALSQSREWHAYGFELPVAVNLSARSLHDAELPSAIAVILAETGAEPGWLELELTESCLLEDARRATQLLRRLQALGVRVAIDDFGTGYSSLAYLKQLPVQQLKIDRSFVQQLGSDENDAAIVRATIELGHSLGLAVVAEGVEDAASWQFLNQLGCDEAQGYYLTRPVPPAELVEWLQGRDALQQAA